MLNVSLFECDRHSTWIDACGALVTYALMARSSFSTELPPLSEVSAAHTWEKQHFLTRVASYRQKNDEPRLTITVLLDHILSASGVSIRRRSAIPRGHLPRSRPTIPTLPA